MIGVATPGVSFAASCLVGSIWLMVPKCNIESGYCLDLGFELKKKLLRQDSNPGLFSVVSRLFQ